ncbi:hypothetical protein V2J09_013560 [Rumex salicifolius]
MATFAHATTLYKAPHCSDSSSPAPRLNSQFRADKLRLSTIQLPCSIRCPSIIPLRCRLIAAPILATSSSNPAEDGRDGRFESSSSGNLGILQPLLKFVSDNFMPLALLSGMTLGLINPTLGIIADRCYLSKVSTFCIFVISGLSLRSEEIGEAAQAWPVGIFGLASILLLTPLFSRLILKLSLQPREFVTGLALFTCMPTTLSSAVTLTQIVGGNSALALAMTLISNLLGVLVIPFSISLLVATGIGVSIPTQKLFTSLILVLLVPTIIGKVLRESFRGLADFTDNNRKFLSILSVVLLSVNPLIQMSKSRPLLFMVKPTSFLLVAVMSIVLHLALLVFNALAIKILSTITGGSKSEFAKEQNAIALLLVASQKTLPVLIAVVDQLDGSLGASGLLTLPCVAAHLSQILMDSLLVNWFFKKAQPARSSKAT